MNNQLAPEDTQNSRNDAWAVERALTELFATREELYDPDLPRNDDANNALVEQEHNVLRNVAFTKARTMESLMEKFGVLSSELARAPVSRPVRLLAASICADVEDLMNA
ncbi:MAG: hypothetical protein ABJN98_21060 [Roseibium sp.]|uniref:hypothetical protein n=1 Tax=Roseibium polysiphoniae TaxID=2571221 RepID=UPI003299CC37